MKNPERVAELLAELRELAENDFERHRLDVLERDLTAPPQVEVIDDTHQRFNGVTYCKGRDGHFVHNHFIHRDVWQYYIGEIPTGYEIHHVDENKANNTIDNLQCLTKKQHSKIHHEKMPVAEYVCEVCGKTYVTSIFARSNRFCSKHCRNHAEAKRGGEEKICAYCGKNFIAFRGATGDCCSHSCASKLQHKEKPRQKIFIEKTCPICGKVFSVTLTRKNQECCSFSCSRKLMWRNKKAAPEIIEKTCPVCGKIFQTVNPNQKHCSASCCQKFARKKKEVEKICPVCGAKFTTSNSIKIYCSKECCDKSYKRTKKKILT